MTSRGPRRKGSRIERELAARHRETAIPCERVPLSGSAGGSFSRDLVIAGRLRAGVKARKNGSGFAVIENWLGTNDALFLRRNRVMPLVVIQFQIWAALLAAAGYGSDRGEP